MNLDTITLDEAVQLLRLPRVVYAEEDGTEVTAQNGRYGPYLKKGTDSRSLEREDQLLTITEEEVRAIYLQPKTYGRRAAAAPLKELGTDPVSERPVVAKDGRFGMYVTDGEYNATLRKDDSLEDLTPERAYELLAERRAKGPAKKAAKRPAKKAAKKSRRRRQPPRRPPQRRPESGADAQIGTSTGGPAGSLLMTVGLLAGVGNREVLDGSRFATHVDHIRKDPAVSRQAGIIISNKLTREVPDLTAARPLVESTAATLVGSSAFGPVIRAMVTPVHSGIHDRWQRSCRPASGRRRSGARRGPCRRGTDLANELPPDLDITLTSLGDQSFASTTIEYAHWLKLLAWLLPLLGLLCFAAVIVHEPGP